MSVESNIKFHSVQSSNLQSVGYSEEKRVLFVRFLNNSLYAYYDVPKSVFEELLNAPSKGHYLDINVKKKGYNYKRIE